MLLRFSFVGIFGNRFSPNSACTNGVLAEYKASGKFLRIPRPGNHQKCQYFIGFIDIGEINVAVAAELRSPLSAEPIKPMVFACFLLPDAPGQDLVQF